MIRLNEYSHKSEYQGLNLKLCGLLFLSTPHSGAADADWNSFLIDIGKLTWGIRPEILNSLKSFNPLSAEAQEDFANMKHQVPFDAFYETKMTKIAQLNRHVLFPLLKFTYTSLTLARSSPASRQVWLGKLLRPSLM
jgi:hypothetical protein